jgi:signal transduction histidine kinase
MHDRPREGLNDVEMEFLDDIAITIMSYLEVARVKEAHRRSENMVKGLGAFVEGRSSLREWWLDTKLNEALGPQDSKDGTETQSNMKHKSEQDSASTPVRTEHVSAGVTIEAKTAGYFGSQDNPLLYSSSRLPEDTKHQAGSKLNMKPFVADLQETLLSADLKDMFSRASNVIRECIEVDGTIFLDASIGTFGGHNGELHRKFERLESTQRRIQESTVSYGGEVRLKSTAGDYERSELSIDSSDSGQLSMKSLTEGDSEKKMCGVLGLSVPEKATLGEDKVSECYVSVTEKFLQGLLRRYPRGQVFDLCEGGSLIPNKKIQIIDVAKDGSKSSETLPTRRHRESAKQKDARAILQMLPGACSVVFSPLWDSHRERWFAGSFAWTTQSARVLTLPIDLNYLAAFGNSIMADVARLDAIASDQAKTDFISSISHELRTPLHGILASVEFLQDTALDLFQNNMVDTIKRCGTTLLDTIQHVLDFAKINSFTKPKRNGAVEEPVGEGSQPRTMGLNVDIDLSVVTEDVVDSVYAGHEFQSKSSREVPDDASGFPSKISERNSVYNDIDQKKSGLKKEGIEVIMDIDWKSNWVFKTQSGALRRILMNLLGNSLKYTDAGWVKVSLQSNDINSTQSQSQKSVITMTVSDSGRGISQEFLHSHMFTPFIQEDSMNPGTGLGLSIVLQIVRSLGGTIDVESEQGVGTEVKVSLTLDQVPLLHRIPMDMKHESLALKVREKTSGLTLGLVGFDIHSSVSEKPTSILNAASKPSLYLQSSLESMATVWFDMKVIEPALLKDSPPDIYIANEYQILSSNLRRLPILTQIKEHRSSTV